MFVNTANNRQRVLGHNKILIHQSYMS